MARTRKRGYEVARALRSDDDTPILVSVTGYGEATDEHRAREAGFERHLVKPLSVDDLADLLE